MLILGIESSTSRSSVALVEGGHLLGSAELGVPRRHGEFLAPAVRFCLAQADRRIDQVGGVAVGTGPGLYTGLRVGIALAQTLAASHQLPTVGVSGLDVLAFRYRHAQRLLCTTVDARRGEVFWGLYRPSPGGVQRIGDRRVGAASALAADLEGYGEPTLLVGDPGDAVREDLARVADLAAATWPTAADLAELAHDRFVREDTVRPETLRPTYLRHPDAAIGWQARGRLRSDGA